MSLTGQQETSVSGDALSDVGASGNPSRGSRSLLMFRSLKKSLSYLFEDETPPILCIREREQVVFIKLRS